jgi:tetratricopeptide (TPR) repeat protein
LVLVLLLVQFAFFSTARAASPEVLFRSGVTAYQSADYAGAARAFHAAAALQPASGILQNLGLARWQTGASGEAVLAWEQALWMDPLNSAARNNLKFARRMAQLESPDLTWYEVVSTWAPANWWAWVAGGSFWLAVGMTMLPGILRLRRAAWHQWAAALGMMIFLLSIPALVGVHTRSRMGFILQKDTPLRLTPTSEAQATTQLAAGEPARLERVKGRYYFVRVARTQGWIEKSQLGLVCSR